MQVDMRTIVMGLLHHMAQFLLSLIPMVVSNMFLAVAARAEISTAVEEVLAIMSTIIVLLQLQHTMRECISISINKAPALEILMVAILTFSEMMDEVEME